MVLFMLLFVILERNSLFHCMEKYSMDIPWYNFFCVLQKKINIQVLNNERWVNKIISIFVWTINFFGNILQSWYGNTKVLYLKINKS